MDRAEHDRPHKCRNDVRLGPVQLCEPHNPQEQPAHQQDAEHQLFVQPRTDGQRELETKPQLCHLRQRKVREQPTPK